MDAFRGTDAGTSSTSHSVPVATIAGFSGGLITLALLESIVEENSQTTWVLIETIITAAASLGCYSATLNRLKVGKHADHAHSLPVATLPFPKRGKSSLSEKTTTSGEQSANAFLLVRPRNRTWQGLIHALTDIQNVIHVCIIFTLGFPLYSFNIFYLPRLMRRISSPVSDTLLLLPIYLIAAATAIVLHHFTASLPRRSQLSLSLCSHGVALTGYAALYLRLLDVPYLAATLTTSSLYASAALLLIWPAMNAASPTVSSPSSFALRSPVSPSVRDLPHQNRHPRAVRAAARASTGALRSCAGALGGVIGVAVYKARPSWEAVVARHDIQPTWEQGHVWAAGFLALGAAGMELSSMLLKGQAGEIDEEKERLSDCESEGE